MARPWYAFYPADYGRDTGHLSLIEHGAYRALMDHYYATAAPLPADEARLLHLCRAGTRAERAAVRFVLREFFTVKGDGWHHKRVDAELAKAAEISAKCSFAARARHGGKDAPAAADGLPSQSQPQSQENMDSGFAEFWTAFPKREAKGAATKAYARACGLATPQQLLAASHAYAARREGQDMQFTKTPASWLAQQCWLDDVPSKAGAVVDEAAAARAWDGRAAPLVAEIGAASFQAFFAGSDFAAGPPAKISVAAPYLRDLIARKFSQSLRRAYGECALDILT